MPDDTTPKRKRPIRPFEDLRSTGLLWLINATVFHPRGYAFGLVFDEAGEKVIGWKLLGDGSEPWTFGDDCDPEFAAVNEFLTPDGG